MSSERADPELQARAAAARELIRNGLLDPWEALAQVVWPSPKLLAYCSLLASSNRSASSRTRCTSL
jgi:hypothetical protein